MKVRLSYNKAGILVAKKVYVIKFRRVQKKAHNNMGLKIVKGDSLERKKYIKK